MNRFKIALNVLVFFIVFYFAINHASAEDPTSIITSLEDQPEVIENVEIITPIEDPVIVPISTPVPNPVEDPAPITTPTPTPIPTTTPTPTPTPTKNQCKFFSLDIKMIGDEFDGQSMLKSTNKVDPRQISCLQKFASECNNSDWKLRSMQVSSRRDYFDSDECIFEKLGEHSANAYFRENEARIRAGMEAEYQRLIEINNNKLQSAGSCYAPCQTECFNPRCNMDNFSNLPTDEAQLKRLECIRSCETQCDSSCKATTGFSYLDLRKERSTISKVRNSQNDSRLGFIETGLVFDMQCNVVEDYSPSNFCGTIFAMYTASPISLILEANFDINKETSIVNFNLDLSKNKNWTSWKGSKKAPLLVYDPEHKGLITSPTQLFGNWTFGGKTIASLNEKIKDAKPWNHGFEALRTLDLNNDKEISGIELNDLGLWFDENRNAISEPGEVKTLTEVGITKLFYTPDSVGGNNTDIIATKGFERKIEGKTISGKSIDWHGELHSSPEEAFVINSYIPNSKNKISILDLGNEGSNPNSLISGQWVWETNDGVTNKGTFGMLSFKQIENKLNGFTFVEIPVAENNNNIRTVLNTSQLKGEVFINKEGLTEINFRVKNKNSTTLTTALLVDNKLKGRSKTTFTDDAKKTTLEFNWTAKRF